jgi:hypothetical protein
VGVVVARSAVRHRVFVVFVFLGKKKKKERKK